jgi:NADPH:quinone reductase-like Zn-dependent oxidoreductase
MAPDHMRAVRLQPPGGIESIVLEEIPVPAPQSGEVLVRVHAAAITRDELDWPIDRLPATPSYELSGVVAGVGAGVEAGSHSLDVGTEVYALTPFDRDGVAAEYAVVPARVLAARPAGLGHTDTAAIPMAGLSAWQGLVVHGGLQSGQRVLVHGAGGGVGHVAVQLARSLGAHVIGTTSAAATAHSFTAHQLVDHTAVRFEDEVEPVDLVFDTSGGELLARSAAVLRQGGRIVTIAEQPPAGFDATYFVVEPDGGQLRELTRLVDAGDVRPAVDSVFALTDAASAFRRSMARGKRGKVVLRVIEG